ncbi:MAG: DUF4168 domain-containing protein [Stigonema ocellatum SAG 48.90 = DSM 106950]|nr:DUF4168 domain-containing protein [Stigonema ocellatum SAG 48.90 = DSM 106950]
MKIFYNFCFQLSLTWILFPSLFLGNFATRGLISTALVFNSKVNAQTQTPAPVNNDEVQSYARAMLAMEPARQQAFEEIKKILGSAEPPKIVCNDSNSLSSLPSKARDIAMKYCNRYQKVVEDNGLTIERFNKLTVDIQNNETLKRQIYNTLLRLQKSSSSQ